MADLGYEYYTGKAVVRAHSRSGQEADRDTHPKEFDALMKFQWLRVGGLFLVGIITLSIVRRQDRLDPFSENFAGSDAIDELEEYLDNKIEEGKKSQKRQVKRPPYNS